MTQQPRISKSISYTADEWAEIERWMAAHGVAEFSPFAKAAVREKMEAATSHGGPNPPPGRKA